MGLLDVLNGMRNGPRGQVSPSDNSGGMSPVTMAILALLAYKGIKHLTGSQAQAPTGSGPQPPMGNPTNTGMGGGLGNVLGGLLGGAQAGGGLGDLLRGGLSGPLGGLLAGGAAGSVLSGGLESILRQFQQNGHGEAANSWVGTGPNKDVSEQDMAKSIGLDDIDAIAGHTGLSRDQLLSELRRQLPGVIDEMTPDGRVPSGDEINRRV